MIGAKHSRIVICIIFFMLMSACSSTSQRSREQLESSSQAYVRLGLGYFRQKNRVLAIENLQKAIEINPDSASAHNYLAVVFQEYGRANLAEKHYKRALDLNEGDGEVHNNFGIFLFSQKKYKQAEEQFLKAVDDVKYATPAVAMEHAALSAVQQEDLNKAEAYFRNALKMNPRLPRSLLEMAKISMSTKKYLNVRAYIQRYEDVAKHNPQSLWLAIQAEKKLKDRNAVARLEIFLRNNFPDSKEAKMLKDSGS